MFPGDQDPPANGGPTLASRPDRWISPEEYLAFERASETKHEYLDGQIFPMSGASLEHNTIVVNLIFVLKSALKGRPFRVLPSDMRLRVPSTGLYTYPDVTIVGGEPQLQDKHFDVLLNPTVLIDVLSLSTERTDRGRKAVHYKRIPTLKELLLVSQDDPRIELYRRGENDEWRFIEASGLDASITLESVGCVLPLSDVYERVF